MLAFLLTAVIASCAGKAPEQTFVPPVTHTELLADGSVLQVHSDLSFTITTVESVVPGLATAMFEPGEVVYEWKNADGVTCRARVDCVTLKYEDCVDRAVRLRKIMQKYDPPVPGKGE